ncbi:hypothetical protein WJX72_004167 [[Myrmecia] bisecta]|uniref:Coat protein n=1 Tax=[Myrmecia] bisecta TaxID=41462 RepID=A0AAW1Q1K5_9CHLO
MVTPFSLPGAVPKVALDAQTLRAVFVANASTCVDDVMKGIYGAALLKGALRGPLALAHALAAIINPSIVMSTTGGAAPPMDNYTAAAIAWGVYYNQPPNSRAEALDIFLAALCSAMNPCFRNLPKWEFYINLSNFDASSQGAAYTIASSQCINIISPILTALASFQLNQLFKEEAFSQKNGCPPPGAGTAEGLFRLYQEYSHGSLPNGAPSAAPAFGPSTAPIPTTVPSLFSNQASLTFPQSKAAPAGITAGAASIASTITTATGQDDLAFALVSQQVPSSQGTTAQLGLAYAYCAFINSAALTSPTGGVGQPLTPEQLSGLGKTGKPVGHPLERLTMALT